MQKLNCRMCGSLNLEKYMDLGKQPPSDQFQKEEDLNEPTIYYPLAVNLCSDCGNHQLTYVVDPTVLYNNNYPYVSSTTETGKKHYFDFAKHVIDKIGLQPGNFVIDIGSNIGVLLEGFKNNGMKVLGIDPSCNVVKMANERGIETICEFFGEKTSHKVKSSGIWNYGQAKAIVATNVFAHVDDLDDFLIGVKNLLDTRGVFIFESPSFLELYKNNSFSATYHEHLNYLSLTSVSKLLEKHNLEVFSIEKQDIHEGSFRCYIARKDKFEIESSVYEYLEEEEEYKIGDLDIMLYFGEACKLDMLYLRTMIVRIKERGESIALLSSPAKGSTLVNYLKMDSETFDFATDKSELKIGKYLPGTSIKVYPDSEILERMPNYMLLLAWNFKDEILRNNQEYINKGGKIIVPFPDLEIVEKIRVYR